MRICEIEGCDNKHNARGWCAKHYWRWMMHGDPLGGKPFRKPRNDGEGWINSDGYRMQQVDGRSVVEHRYVWAQAHGALLPGQNIHHKNGNRTDNRLSNLEVWDTSQPAGQRPEDKVEYAVEMLNRYAPELLA